ncbi:short-chain dehydrogenase [Actinoplanes rectilineatus]|uniref:short-chain dehydrogenase n=1 Tax=Actinoplanes rectilineatus TaxID=113571 RepID=UPI000AA330EE|nr:short-chain dehydrogenase [Actinoplanes rectilineatus]
MRTVVIAGGTRGIGGALAARLRQRGDRVIALGSADADLTSVAATDALIRRLPDRIDTLVLSAGAFSPQRVETAEGFERSFAIMVLARYLLAEGLRPALNRADHPMILSLTGTGGIKGGVIHWDDLQLTREYRMMRAVLQGTRMNDLLGAGFTRRDPTSRIRYVLYNPLFVDSGLHRHLRQPTRTLLAVAARLFASSTTTAADRLMPLLTDPLTIPPSGPPTVPPAGPLTVPPSSPPTAPPAGPLTVPQAGPPTISPADPPARPPTAPLTALRRGTPIPVDGPDFDPVDADRAYEVVARLVATPFS